MRDAEEYRPLWLEDQERGEVGIAYPEEPWTRKEESSPEETRFFVTLMMSEGDKEGCDGYVPKDNKKRGKEEASGSDTSSEGNNKEEEPKLLSRRRRRHRKQRKMKNRKSDDSEDEGKFIYVDRSTMNRIDMAVPLEGTTPPPEWVVDRSISGKDAVVHRETLRHGMLLPRRGESSASLDNKEVEFKDKTKSSGSKNLKGNPKGAYRRNEPRSQSVMEVETVGATLPKENEVRRYVTNSAIALYNATPQEALGGKSPHDIVYGLPSESAPASSSATLV
jgi:hypothetical protein